MLPVTVETREGAGKFKLASRPFFYGELHGPDSSPKYGVVNLPSEREGGTIREYMSYFPMEGKAKHIPSFVMAMAMAANPHLTPAGKRNNQIIDYTSREFKVIPLDELEERLEELNNRYVIIGAMGETSDMHATPVNSYMPGMLVHAYSLSTLLSGKRFTTMPGWIDYALSTLLCLVLVLTALMHTGKTKGILLRIIQVIMLLGLVWTGYVLYIDRMIICDFSRTLLIILFSLFALDICNGLDGLIALIRGRMQKIAQK